jgi:hypothetical protein
MRQMYKTVLWLTAGALPLATAMLGCPSEVIPNQIVPVASETRAWEIVASGMPSALLSIASAGDRVIAVGADKGAGPMVARYDGQAWSQLRTGVRGDLWWVHAFSASSQVAVGQGALVLHLDGDKVTRLPSKGFANQTVYGAWGTGANDFYVVGSATGRDGFIWHWDGQQFTAEALPENLPRSARGELPGLFKVWGRGDDVWVVGSLGTILHRRGNAAFVLEPSATKTTLFTVHGTPSSLFISGGQNDGTLLEQQPDGSFRNVTPLGAPLLQGVFASGTDVVAVGERARVFAREGTGAFAPVALTLPAPVQSLHAAMVDARGDYWAVGGNVLSPVLDAGTIVHYAPKSRAVAPFKLPVPPGPVADAGDGGDGSAGVACPAEAIAAAATFDGKSIARRWNEQLLGAIRRDLPRPTVHARNLFHVSAALWDVYAAYDASVQGLFVTERRTSADLDAARREAMSYAAYRVLDARYRKAVGGAISAACFADQMRVLGYDPADTREVGDDPRALGNRIGRTILAQNASDGANEDKDYAAPVPVMNPNTPLIVDEPGANPTDPNIWQPLNLSVAATQNGIVLPAGAQGYIGAHWGDVRPFAMTRASAAQPWKDPGLPPRLTDAGLRSWVLDVLRRSSELDASDAEKVDISPAALGSNSLGVNDGKGYPVNPITNAAYLPQPVARGDFGRVLAEYWADGPKSETPPGHWNTIANKVADNAANPRKLNGVGAQLSLLSWDVHVYVALNGALHDAAIAAWDVKRRTLAPRPLTLIRYLGGLGQSSDPGLPAYNAGGLPLVPGLLELVTKESSAPGQRHAHLRAFTGTLAVKSWRGEPGDRVLEASGSGWVRIVDWMPYQRRTFVTPAFPGFISGHSTFSRAAAEVLTGLTGSPYFPNGFAEVAIPAATFLSFERGPSQPIKLQWASYYDAADQAGQSRIWGGIHIAPDDFAGRRMGAEIGRTALERARALYTSVVP